MRHVVAFLAGGAAFVAIQQLVGPAAVILLGALLFAAAVVGEIWRSLDAALADWDDRELARRRWREWFGS